MKKILFILAIFSFFLYGHNTYAATKVLAKDLYAGSVVVEENFDTPSWWYIDEMSGEKYHLKDGVSVTRLLQKFGQGIHDKDLQKLATSTESTNIDYQLVNKYQGKFLIQVDKAGEAWYLNPLDDLLYRVENGTEGLQQLKYLALDISTTKLKSIQSAKDDNFLVPKKSEIDFTLYQNVWQTLKQNYYQTIDSADLFYGSLKGLTQSLNDPYTEFFDPRGKTEFNNRLEGAVEGIGTMVDLIDGKVVIIAPLPDSPAEKAGLLPYDQILKANDQDLSGMTLDQAITYIKGPSGSKVNLTIYRPDESKTFQVEVVREKIVLPTVTAKKIDNNLAYFKINIFAIDLEEKFNIAKAEIIDKNTKGIIIDLRNNPGGYTDSAINLAEHWLAEGDLIFSEKYPNKKQNFYSNKGGELNLATVILINNGSASASEIFTSALKEHGKAQVVGQTTFGKGTGQMVDYFSDGSAMKYTIFEWLTAGDKSIEKVGVTPTYEILNTKTSDLQLEKAKDLLRK